MRVDRLTSGLVEFSKGRQLVFSVATQSIPRQRIEILGTEGRLEIEVPFNPDPGKGSRIIIGDGRDLYGGGSEVEEFLPCDQYTL